MIHSVRKSIKKSHSDFHSKNVNSYSVTKVKNNETFLRDLQTICDARIEKLTSFFYNTGICIRSNAFFVMHKNHSSSPLKNKNRLTLHLLQCLAKKVFTKNLFGICIKNMRAEQNVQFSSKNINL